MYRKNKLNKFPTFSNRSLTVVFNAPAVLQKLGVVEIYTILGRAFFPVRGENLYRVYITLFTAVVKTKRNMMINVHALFS